MQTEHTALLASAAFAAGALNAIAGGGSFLTFPALVLTGFSPIVANATSAVAASPGYLGSALGFRHELAALARQRVLAEVTIAAVGGVLGALLLLVTPAATFRALVPWLLLFATAVFWAGPMLVQRLASAHSNRPLVGARAWGLLAVCIYGGYFNGGLGILLMALYTATGEANLHTANALKNLNSLVLSLLSVATLATAGAIAWEPAMLMMAACTAGGYLGARWAHRWRTATVRVVIIVTGVLMSAIFFVR